VSPNEHAYDYLTLTLNQLSFSAASPNEHVDDYLLSTLNQLLFKCWLMLTTCR